MFWNAGTFGVSLSASQEIFVLLKPSFWRYATVNYKLTLRICDLAIFLPIKLRNREFKMECNFTNASLSAQSCRSSCMNTHRRNFNFVVMVKSWKRKKTRIYECTVNCMSRWFWGKLKDGLLELTCSTSLELFTCWRSGSTIAVFF